jgi:predicted phosphate transport protein (TIGR00153 family)
MLKSKNHIFFDLFEQQIAIVHKGTHLFYEMIGNYQDVESKVKAIKAVEKEGDEIVRSIMNELNSTFITPLEREDIVELAHTMDSMIDIIDGVADRMYLYQIHQPDPRVLAQANILVKCSSKLIELIRTLRKLDHQVVANIAREIKELEHESDANYRKMVSDLLNAPNANPIEVIKLKEIYDKLEDCADFAEDVTNLVEGIVLKNA